MPEPPPPALEPQPAVPKPTAASLAARMLNMIAAPADVFDEVKGTAHFPANWLAPALLFIAVSWLGSWLVFSQEAFNRQFSDYIEKSAEKTIARSNMPQAQADQVRAVTEKFVPIYKAGAFVGPPVLAFATPFLWGLILWLVGAKILKGNFPYMKAVEVAGLANMIGVLGELVRQLLVLALGNLFASPSLALLVKDFDPQIPSHALLALINVMTFWCLAVRSIGLSRLAGVSFAKAALWVFGIWAAYNALFAGLGFAMQAMYHK